MLLIKSSKGLSVIHDVGLIARDFIPKGTAIWGFSPHVDRLLQQANFSLVESAESRRQIKGYSFFDPYLKAWVLCGDDARFTNHSDSPNTYMDGRQTYAARDIFRGEEITEDYRLLGVTF